MGIKRSVLIRLIDLKVVEYFSRNKILHKTQKTEIAIFPLYFLGVSFIIFNEFVGGSNYLEIKKSFFSRPIHMIEHKIPEGQKIWTSFIIFTPPYSLVPRYLKGAISSTYKWILYHTTFPSLFITRRDSVENVWQF